MKVFDLFTYFNENDLLEIRLKYLNDSVDYFVICESNLTHSGKPKPYNLEDNWERFKPFHDKIIYLKVEQSTEGLEFKKVDRYDPTDGSWFLETQQRSYLNVIDEMIGDDDLCLVGDLDEIPNKHTLNYYKEFSQYDYCLEAPLSIPMNFFAYYLNNMTISGPDVEWNGTVMCEGKDFKQYGSQGLRDRRNSFKRTVTHSGYHFSYMGGLESIKKKIQSFAHTEFNRPELLDDNHILEAIQAGRDVLGRPGVTYQLQPLEWFPGDIRAILEQNPEMIKL